MKKIVGKNNGTSKKAATSKTKVKKVKTKDRTATEEKLIEAAGLVFSKHGYQGATTRMIAEKANVNLALINRYFDGKFGLLLKIIELKAIECSNIADEYPPQNNLTDELTEYAHAQTKKFYEGITLFKIILVQYLTDPKFLKKFQEIAEIFKDKEKVLLRIQNLVNVGRVVRNIPAKEVIEILDDYIFGQITGDTLLYGVNMEEIIRRQKPLIQLLTSPYDLTKLG